MRLELYSVWFNVQHNQFTGAIPSAMVLENVNRFDISWNNISGPIPGNFVAQVVPNIRHLYMGNNQITGTVPEDFVNLGQGRVEQIHLNDNQVRRALCAERVKHASACVLIKV
jgi:Leucine Rich Repeat